MNVPKNVDSLLVGVTYDDGGNGDISIMVVGKKVKGNEVEIINAFQGEEAEELWKKLSVKKY